MEKLVLSQNLVPILEDSNILKILLYIYNQLIRMC